MYLLIDLFKSSMSSMSASVVYPELRLHLTILDPTTDKIPLL
jgi:hypothetical protein